MHTVPYLANARSPLACAVAVVGRMKCATQYRIRCYFFHLRGPGNNSISLIDLFFLAQQAINGIGFEYNCDEKSRLIPISSLLLK